MIDGGLHGGTRHQLLIVVVLDELAVRVQPDCTVADQNFVCLNLFAFAWQA